MKKRFQISQEEKNRILNLHESRKIKEWNLITEQVTGNPQPPVVGATPPATSVTNIPIQTAPTNTPTNTTTTPKPNYEDGVYNNDKDYDYKKEGDKYFFKLKTNPVSPKAKALKKQNKYINWTEATGNSKIAISKLPFLSTLTAFKGVGTEVDGSDETFDAPTQTAPVSTTQTAPVPTTQTAPVSTSQTTPVSTTQTAPTTNNTDLAADLKTASQIRQEFRQGKRDKNKAQRQYNQMVNKYNKLKDKMSPQDSTAYLQAINQLKQQLS